MFESKSGIFLIAGLVFFGLSFLVMGLLPWLIYADEEELTVQQLAEQGIIPEFADLAERFPEQFQRHFPDGVTTESLAEALTVGHKAYVGEGCWHCHSQQVRPVSNEDRRWGRISHASEYQNVLQRPVLFGTRRVGPDLSRAGGVRSNDWHVAHFYRPTDVVSVSVMPSYPWFYDDEGYPNKRGLSIITYIQWLGSWLPEYPYYQHEGPPGAATLEDQVVVRESASGES
ncbi:MAG: cbb3-type cytochrome c oxidase subunit II [Planctomycetota bacterium]